MRLEWTDPALDDLEGIRDYISQDSPGNAKPFIQRIFDTTEKQLIDFPQIGRQVPEAEDSSDEIRELLFEGYRIIYWLKSTDNVRVLTVIHGGRDLAGAENKPW